MPAILNHKICDQSPFCGGVGVCPTKAITYNGKNKKIEIDLEKCISCGLCVPECPIGAFGCAKDQKEYNKLKKLIENDPRDPKDLFVDRFGADIISENIMIEAKDVSKVTAKGKVLVEFLDGDSIKCLLKSIPVSEILTASKAEAYYRVLLEKPSEIKKHQTAVQFPYVQFFKDGKLIKTFPYTEEAEKQKLFKELK